MFSENSFITMSFITTIQYQSHHLTIVDGLCHKLSHLITKPFTINPSLDILICLLFCELQHRSVICCSCLIVSIYFHVEPCPLRIQFFHPEGEDDSWLCPVNIAMICCFFWQPLQHILLSTGVDPGLPPVFSCTII